MQVPMSVVFEQHPSGDVLAIGNPLQQATHVPSAPGTHELNGGPLMPLDGTLVSQHPAPPPGPPAPVVAISPLVV